jgi:hypothetical protein
MGIYIITVFLIFIFGLIEIYFKNYFGYNKILKIILYLFLVITIGLRWETGVDWNNYLNNFENTNDFETALINIIGGYEIGYGILVLVFKIISNNYSLFLLFNAFFFYWGIFRMAKKYSPFFFVSILLYYSTNLGMVGANRQLIAIVICLWGLDFVLKKRFIYFFLIILIGSLFHTSAFLFVVYYFINIDFNKTVLFLFLFIISIIGKTELPYLFFNKFGVYFGELASSKTSIYSESLGDNLKAANLSFFGFLKRLVLLAIFTYNYKILSQRFTYYKLLYNGYFIGIVIYLLFSSSFLILVNRGALYFNIMECCLISSQFVLFKNKSDQIKIFIILLFISVGLLIQSISTYPDLFIPYKSLFFNTNYSRQMY